MCGSSYTRESIGRLFCVNLSSLACRSPCYPGTEDLGWSARNKRRWYKLDVLCWKCQRHVTHRSGIICANFGQNRGLFRPCQGAWCASCFVTHPLDTFETAVPRDFNGPLLAEVEDKIRFRLARAGDNICTAFQCLNCHSQNIRGTDLDLEDVRDNAFEFACIRVTLVAFWSHSSRTVSCHLTQVRFISKYSDMLGLPKPLPRLGPFLVGHHLGMNEAILLIMCSLEPGKGRDGRVKFGTARQVRAMVTKVWDTSPEAGGDISLSTSSKAGQYVATCNPAEGRWYQQFRWDAGIRSCVDRPCGTTLWRGILQGHG